MTQQRINCFSGHAPGPVMFARTFDLRRWDGLKDQLLFKEPPQGHHQGIDVQLLLVLVTVDYIFLRRHVRICCKEATACTIRSHSFQDKPSNIARSRLIPSPLVR